MNLAKEKRKILILISDTGGGHRASAEGVKSAILHEYPDKEYIIKILDLWTDYGTWPFNKFVSGYKYLCMHPTYWEFVYDTTKSETTQNLINTSSYHICKNGFKRALTLFQPDIICSMHPLCQAVPLRVLSEIELKIPKVTVVTDLADAHPTWFDKRVDLCFVPGDAIKKKALDAGLELNQIRQYGLPIRCQFWKFESRSKEDVRNEMALPRNSSTCLIMGGGDGVGDVRKIVHEVFNIFLNKNFKDLLIIVICGNNNYLENILIEDFQNYLLNNDQNYQTSKKDIKNDFETMKKVSDNLNVGESIIPNNLINSIDNEASLKKKKNINQIQFNNDLMEEFVESIRFKNKKLSEEKKKKGVINLCIKGFVNNIYDWMSASDLIITKAGPGTIAEACICGLPIILYYYLPGQEECNVDFVIDQKIGAYIPDPKKVAIAIYNLLSSNKLNIIGNKAKKIIDPYAAIKIARDIIQLITDI